MAARTRKTFKLSHSLVGGAVLLVCEALAIMFVPAIGDWIIDLCAMLGSIGVLYIATEVIEEVRSPRHMLGMLSIIVAEFVVFFAAQYHLLMHIDPASFPDLPTDPLGLALHSTMVFVFNPLWVPATGDGRMLLLINTLAAMGLVLFLLQNVWQFRRA